MLSILKFEIVLVLYKSHKLRGGVQQYGSYKPP